MNLKDSLMFAKKYSLFEAKKFKIANFGAKKFQIAIFVCFDFRFRAAINDHNKFQNNLQKYSTYSKKFKQ